MSRSARPKSFLSWVGGKSVLADTIIPLIPKHRCYVEVFAGAAWMLFKKPVSRVEIINDINLDLVTLYRVVKHHRAEFIRQLEGLPVARDEFERCLKTDPNTLTDVQRAARFYYTLRTSFDSRLVHPQFSVATSRPSRFNPLKIEEELTAAEKRLARVYIERRPYEELISRLDRSDTFFYLDPPYFGCENYYGKDIFNRDDFARLATLLVTIKGKFILSLNDVPEMRELFKGFVIRTVMTRYAVGIADKTKAWPELLISNYEPRTWGCGDVVTPDGVVQRHI